MTTIRRDGKGSSFGEWIRKEPRLDSIKQRLSVHDTDFWIHQYRAHTDKVGDRAIDSIMAVEVKTFQADVSFAQRDTLRLVAAIFRETAYTKNGRIRTFPLDMGNEIRIVRMYGYFLLRLSGDAPDNSDQITWHGKSIDTDTLIEILTFSRDPRTLNKRSERRHHLPGKKVVNLDMFRDMQL